MRAHAVRWFASILACLCLAAPAAADMAVTYYSLGDTITHGGFAYRVSEIALADGPALQAVITLYALGQPWVLTPDSFVLMNADDQAFYPQWIGSADGSYRLTDSLTIPAGKNCTLVFSVPFQSQLSAPLYLLCCDGSDAFSCLRIAYQPPQPQNTAPQYAPQPDTLSYTAYSAGTVSHNLTSEPVFCGPCHGTGQCSLCDGKGRQFIGTSMERTCTLCYGSGDCPYCLGTGQIAPD